MNYLFQIYIIFFLVFEIFQYMFFFIYRELSKKKQVSHCKKSRYCAYIICRVKTWFLKLLSTIIIDATVTLQYIKCCHLRYICLFKKLPFQRIQRVSQGYNMQGVFQDYKNLKQEFKKLKGAQSLLYNSFYLNNINTYCSFF